LAVFSLVSSKHWFSKERMQRTLGHDGVREIALATGFGAASSSCSYATAAMGKTLFKKAPRSFQA
jgi:uncharacterized membrane protein YraQ (UPF0718 family)